jgi:hypothetical protein
MAGDHPEPPRGVFVEDFVDVDASLEALRGSLLAGEGWLAPMAGAAERDGATLLLRVGPAWAAERFQRDVRARLGGYRTRHNGFVLWLWWEAAEHPSLFPVLDGDLEVAPLGDGRARLTLTASYVPPLGVIGRGIDRAVLHRVAQSTVRSFLTRVAAAAVARAAVPAERAD